MNARHRVLPMTLAALLAGAVLSLTATPVLAPAEAGSRTHPRRHLSKRARHHKTPRVASGEHARRNRHAVPSVRRGHRAERRHAEKPPRFSSPRHNDRRSRFSSPRHDDRRSRFSGRHYADRRYDRGKRHHRDRRIAGRGRRHQDPSREAYGLRRAYRRHHRRHHGRPWFVAAPRIDFGGSPFYFHVGLGVYFGGLAVEFTLGDLPPAGYLYYDPYCDEYFWSVSEYREHLHWADHPAVLTLVAAPVCGY